MGGSRETQFPRQDRAIFICLLTMVGIGCLWPAQDQTLGQDEVTPLSDETLVADGVERPAFFRAAAPCSSRCPYTHVQTDRDMWIRLLFERGL